MTNKEVKEFFDKHIKKHGLDEYTLVLNNTKRTLGSCNIATKVIKISTWHIKGSKDEVVKDTILHEIAHALSFKKHGRPGMGHGQYWKNACYEVGAKPERVKHTAYTEERPPSKYTLTCSKCEKDFSMHRMPRGARYSCGFCGTELDIKKNW